uniref:Nuclear pore complex protein Nup98-Nup96 n=1 Tax=Lygus hesperus TaxID=30085 RepID=A0A146M9Y3_LYGHE
MFPSSGFPATPPTSSPFARPATTGFNPPVFGGAPTGNTLFGGATTPSSGGLFGSNTTTPAFGQTQTTQPAFGGFTAASSGSTGLFQQNASTSGGLFGSNTTQAFGQPKTSFGFGSTQPSGSLFGQQPQQTSLFGQPSTQSASGLFGSTPGFGTTATATASGGTHQIKFTPVTGTDTMVKNGASTSVSTRHHCITCMKEYENKSLEELRMEDYAAGRKGPQQGAQPAGGMFGASTQPTLFGSTTANTSGGLFGTENKSLFGTTNQGFGATTGSNMFGATNQSNSLFGKPAGTATPFGAPATTATNTFGFNNTSTNLFGSNTAQKPFGATAPQTGSLFGSTSQPSTGFGTQSTGFGTSFGTQPAQNGGLFGAKPPFTLGNTSSGFSFNQPTSTSTSSSIFGAKPATTGFGTGFGAPTSTSTGFGTTAFGQTNQNASPFGLNLGGGTSLFNNTASKPGGLFGQTNTGGNLFGGSGGFGTTNTFNTGTNPLGGLGTQSSLGSGLGSGLGSLGGQGTQNPINQHLNAYSSIPFGDSPLFKNLLAPTGKADELIKPTSPAAQKALISGQNYKISPKSYNKIRIKPVESNNKKSLFDGLDGEDDFTADMLGSVTRPNPKQLVIQPRLYNDVSITQRSRLSGATNPINEMSPVIRTSPKILNIIRKDVRDGGTHDETVVTSRPQTTLKIRDIQSSAAASNQSGSPNMNNNSGTHNEENKETSVASSSDSDMEDTIPAELDGTLTEHPTRIVLRRAGYYTIPSLDELATMLSPDGSCVVDNFTVGRLNYGNVFYADSFDVAGLNLDEIVHFRHKEVTIYPDDDKKPPVGVGLNRRAQVTLDRVWPIDKSTRLPITDPARIACLDYESKLTRASAKHGTRFIEYRPQTGSWVFKVDHFSKYGLSDSDEEDQNPGGETKKIKMGPADSITLDKNIPSSTPLQQVKQVERTLASRAVLLGEEDEEMDDGITTPFALDDEMERRQHFSPTSKLAKEIGTSSHKVQLMKASFFDHGDFNIDGEYLDYEDLDQPPVFQVNGFGFDAKKLAQAFNWYKRSELASIDGYSDAEPDYEPRAEMEAEQPEPTPDDSFDPAIIEQAMAEQIRPKSYVLRHKGFVPYSEVLLKSVSSGCLSDLCVFNGRSCRVGWGPQSKLSIHSTITAATADPAPQLFSILQGRTKDDMSPSLVQCHNLFTSAASQVSFEDTVIHHLEIVYKQSIFNKEGSCPHVSPKNNVVGLHRHNVAAMNLANGYKDPHLKNSSDVWSLCAALWGNIDDCSPDGHSCVMQRKTAVSDWLEVVLSDEVLDEAALTGGTASVYSYLTGHKILEACEEAHKIGDYQMPLLFNQCGSRLGVQSMISKQLAQWRDTEADSHIDPWRLKCLMLAAGLKVHTSSKGVLNTCQEMSWLRAFALHIWYFTSMSASVTDALVDYEKSFSEEMEESFASAPVPLYSDQYSISVYDVRYHLLKLFSTKSHPLEPMLDPITFTPDALDYRLSWLLMRVLMELGYSHVSSYSACLVHMSFASQLEAHGLWHWAVFVILHHPDDEMREKSVKDLLERHVSLEDENEEEDFVRSKLGVPSSWIFEAKAIKARVSKRYDDAAKYLLKAGNWDESHDVIMRFISSTAIANENYDYLEGLLKELAIDERYKDVTGWATGGEVVLEYLGVVRQVNEVVAARDLTIGFHLERLQMQLKDLCLKIKLMKANTPLDRLSRGEMAKRIGDLLQNLVIAHCSDETSAGLNVLGHLMTELPLTSDYSQQEWLAVFASWQNSMSTDEPQ